MNERFTLKQNNPNVNSLPGTASSVNGVTIIETPYEYSSFAIIEIDVLNLASFHPLFKTYI